MGIDYFAHSAPLMTTALVFLGFGLAYLAVYDRKKNK